MAELHEGDLVLQAGTFFRVIRRRLWVILLTEIVCVALAVGFSLQQQPVYEASIKILVGQDREIVTDPGQAINLQTLASTVSEAVTTRPVAERVVRELNLDDPPEGPNGYTYYIVAHTSAEVIPKTQFIEVTYTDTEPRRTQRIANAIGEVFSERVSDVGSRVSAISATVWEPAIVPQSPVSPNPVRAGLIAFVVGTMLGVGLALLLNYMDDRWRSPEEAEQVSGVPTFGVIPEYDRSKGKRQDGMVFSKLRRRMPGNNKGRGNALPSSLVTVRNPASPSAEAYRALRTSILYAFVDSSPRVIVSTSPDRGEGKTTICANLGAALSQLNNNTLIVDCDLRVPAMHKVFALPNHYGLVNVLVGEYDFQEACHEPLPGLKVLTAGPIPPTPAELLSSERFAKFIDRARHQFEYVLIDVPPVRLVSDPVIVARHGDGALLVLDAQSTSKGSVRQSVRRLEAVGATVFGTVMNRSRVPAPNYYDYMLG